ALPRPAAAALALRLRRRGAGDDAARAGIGLSRRARAPARGGAGARAGRAVRAYLHQSRCAGEQRPRRKARFMARPLRLIAADPLDALARTLEALLVVASS